MSDDTLFQEGKHILEVLWIDEAKIRLILSHSPSHTSMLRYEENEIAMEKVNGLIQEINHYVTLLNTLDKPDNDYFRHLQKACRALYSDIFSPAIKQSLQNSSYTMLEFIIDEQLLYIPWELLFDGRKFLSEKFIIGRKIRTRRKETCAQHDGGREPAQLKMLIAVDPTSDLKMAYHEGALILKEFHREKAVEVEFYSCDMVNHDFMKKNLPDYDIIHYAGHVTYDTIDSNKSGWLLSDGILSITDIKKMGEGNMRMPRLVFCNACQSGSVKKLPKGSNEQIVEAFIGAGAECYIGTFTKVSDEYAAPIAGEFYHQLLRQGRNAGESLQKAKELFKDTFSTKSYSWINYIYYGRPDYHLLSRQSKFRSLGPHPRPSSRYGKKWKWALPAILLFFSMSIILWLGFKGHRKHEPFVIEAPSTWEKIESARKGIYEILRQREELKEGRERAFPIKNERVRQDEWRSQELGLALFTIVDPSERLSTWAVDIMKNLNRRLVKLLTKEGRIKVVERKELDKILKEVGLILSDWPLNLEDRKLFGKLLQARIMLFVEGYEESSDIYLCYKLVHAETGVILEIEDDIRITKKVASHDLAHKMYTCIKKDIFRHFPLQGRIVEIQDRIISINIGSKVGVASGDIFEIINPREKIIGKIKVRGNGVHSERSECEIIEGGEGAEGLSVRLAE
ncbi:MAG: CHAT domain-containing protein [bacterium]